MIDFINYRVKFSRLNNKIALALVRERPLLLHRETAFPSFARKDEEREGDLQLCLMCVYFIGFEVFR